MRPLLTVFALLAVAACSDDSTGNNPAPDADAFVRHLEIPLL